jgi:hypothetical protein
VAFHATTTAGRITKDALAAAVGGIEDALSATVDAMRFLAARVESMERDAARFREPVDGVEWLVPPPAVDTWAGAIIGYLDGAGVSGPVVHGECGDGRLAAALADSGRPIRGIEPRGALAWSAAGRGVDVGVGRVPALLGEVPSGTLGAAVLSGVVDRLPVDGQIDLLDRVTERLSAGGAIVVIGTRPEAVERLWGPVGLDLLPGRPLHPETWAVLLHRSGFEDVGRLDDESDGGSDTFALRGRRPA